MYCLFLDFSFSVGVCALFEDGSVVEEVHLSRADSKHPCRVWQDLLGRKGISLDEVSFFSCGIGPGSFTGIRNAAATVKGASYATNKPIVALSSLLLFAPLKEGSFCIAVDGGAGGVYSQRLEKRGDTYILSPTTQEKEFSFPPDVTAVSPSFEWCESLPKGAIVQKTSALVVAKVAFQEWKLGNVHTSKTLPLAYLRKTQAEIEREKRA